MPTNTEVLNLYKVDTTADGNLTFNIDKMLNENWDKLDKSAKDTNLAISTTNSNLRAYVDASKTAANAYTDGKATDLNTLITQKVQELNTSISQKETPAGAQSKATTAETNAKAYTDTKAAAAETNSKAYTDTKTTNLNTTLCQRMDDTRKNLLFPEEWKVGFDLTMASNNFDHFYAQRVCTNEVVKEVNPFGVLANCWKVTDPGHHNGAGGYDTAFFNISDTKTYRYAVYMKKKVDHEGTCYFGCNPTSTLKLDGTADNNPYFWSGDLPSLDEWYLLVGYVHGKDYTGTNLGGMYNMKGDKVLDFADFKLPAGATKQAARSYLYYVTAGNPQLFIHGPRVEVVDGTETSLDCFFPTLAKRITAAEANAKTYADGKAATAESNAKAYTDGKAATAESNAKTYADGKAATAESNAKVYADGKAATAESNAKAYTDGKAATAESNAKTYADGKAATAESNAKVYADGKAATAETNAKTYTDGKVTDLTTLIGQKETPAGAQTKATTAETNAKTYADGKGAAAETNAKSYTDGRFTTMLGGHKFFVEAADPTTIQGSNVVDKDIWFDITEKIVKVRLSSAWVSFGAVYLT